MSDDELEVNSNNFGKILKTRMGAGPEKNNHAQTGVSIEGADNVEGDEYNVAANVREAFDFAHGMWQIPAESNEDMSPAEATVSAEDLEKALTAATASQKQDFHTNRQTAKLVEPSLRHLVDILLKKYGAGTGRKKRQRTRRASRLLKLLS